MRQALLTHGRESAHYAAAVRLLEQEADEGPQCPDELRYLLAWARELAASRSYDMNGAHGFTYPMIDAWARLTDRDPSPLEVEGLFQIDVAMRSPAKADATEGA